MSTGNLRSVLPPGSRIVLSGPSSSSTRKALLNPSNEEAWTAPSLPASIHLIFPQPLSNASHIAITFQGGFVGTEAMMYVATQGRGKQSEVEMGLMMGGKIYPEDKSKRQVFKIVYPPSTQHPPLAGQAAGTGNLPTTSVPGSGAQITTVVPPNPSGQGRPAQSLVDGIGGEDSWDPPVITELKIEFEKSSDQYGRITVYSIEVLG